MYATLGTGHGIKFAFSEIGLFLALGCGLQFSRTIDFRWPFFSTFIWTLQVVDKVSSGILAQHQQQNENMYSPQVMTSGS
jgi:hypothetical protein